MAKHGYIIEAQIAAKDVDALNKSAVATADVDGGEIVSLGALNADGVFVATKLTAGTGGNVWMAYNPSEHFTKVGDNVFAGLTVDPRDYTNLANRPMDVFKPQVGDIITILNTNLKEGETPTQGSFLEMGADGYEVKASATADTFSLEVIEAKTIPFPQKGIGFEAADAYVTRVAFN